MSVEAYFSKVGDGIEFIIAFGSIMGLLGLIFGIVMVLGGYRSQGLKVIVFSFILVGLTGPSTGIKNFNIR